METEIELKFVLQTSIIVTITIHIAKCGSCDCSTTSYKKLKLYCYRISCYKHALQFSPKDLPILDKN